MSRSKNPRTTDLALATYLILQGHEYEMEFDRSDRHGANISAWVFNHRVEEVRSSIQEYREGSALVEPASFSRVLVTSRKEIIEFSEQLDAPSH